MDQNGSATMLAIKTSAGVAPAPEFEESIAYRLQSIHARDLSRRCKSKIGVSVFPQKELMSFNCTKYLTYRGGVCFINEIN